MIFPDTVLQDLRYGIRTLSRNPWSTVITVLSLALGIGVNTAFFTAYHAFVARRLDARNPAEMVNIALIRDSGAAGFAFSYPDYEAYRDSVRALQGLVAFRPARVTLSNAGGMIDQRTAMSGSALGRLGLMTAGASNTEFAQVFIVSENYFAVLGVSAIRGRTFENPTVPGPVPGPVSAAPYVLISENYWQRRFGGDSEIVGKTLQLNGVPVTVIGVTPHDFAGTSVGAPAFWIPLGLEPQINADSNWLRERENGHYRMFGRLAPGVTVAQAKAQTALAADRIRKLHALGTEGAKPATVLVWPGSPFPLPLNYYPGLTDAVLLLMAGAAMILAVAAANAGSLQLARSRSREVELHTRLSLGATRARLIRQLLTENALVGILAGVFAMLVSWGFLKLAVKAFVDGMPVEFMAFVFDVSPSLPVFGYVLLVSLNCRLPRRTKPGDAKSEIRVDFHRTGQHSVRSRPPATGSSRRRASYLLTCPDDYGQHVYAWLDEHPSYGDRVRQQTRCSARLPVSTRFGLQRQPKTNPCSGASRAAVRLTRRDRHHQCTTTWRQLQNGCSGGGSETRVYGF